MALLLDRDRRIVAANEAARDFFDVDPARLPSSIVEATLEGNLVDVLRAGTPEGETYLVHRRRSVRTKLVPGPQTGETLMFLVDVTELRALQRVRQEFVANLVHELKTPITSLRLTAESLLGDPTSADRARFAHRQAAVRRPPGTPHPIRQFFPHSLPRQGGCPRLCLGSHHMSGGMLPTPCGNRRRPIPAGRQRALR